LTPIFDVPLAIAHIHKGGGDVLHKIMPVRALTRYIFCPPLSHLRGMVTNPGLTTIGIQEIMTSCEISSW
jgi:hypothetical protein